MTPCRARRPRLKLLPCLLSLVAALCVFNARPTHAHPLDSASLSLTEVERGRFTVIWQPSAASPAESPAISFPAPCRSDGATLDCGSSGLLGTIELPWLEQAPSRVMIEIEWQDGTRLLRTLDGARPRLAVYRAADAQAWRFLPPLAADYGWLGIEHILTGFDHLLFVIALVLLVRGGRLLLLTITAFTLAHSVSLAATVLGLIRLPGAPVEATIALSIVLICAEALRPSYSFTRSAPWVVASAFGLLHGLGFATALLEIGLPSEHVAVSLLFFNMGVELGQLAVIGVMLSVARLGTGSWPTAWFRSGALYAIGSVAAAWSIERMAAVLAAP
jgi:hydrogenase/urease accessory protein HupE